MFGGSQPRLIALAAVATGLVVTFAPPAAAQVTRLSVDGEIWKVGCTYTLSGALSGASVAQRVTVTDNGVQLPGSPVQTRPGQAAFSTPWTPQQSGLHTLLAVAGGIPATIGIHVADLPKGGSIPPCGAGLVALVPSLSAG